MEELFDEQDIKALNFNKKRKHDPNKINQNWWRKIKEQHKEILKCECGQNYIKTREKQDRCHFCLERPRPAIDEEKLISRSWTTN